MVKDIIYGKIKMNIKEIGKITKEMVMVILYNIRNLFVVKWKYI
jgi:hypothetical protein